jgi:tetratricopeptide (TPR) repeat protein
MPPVMQLDSGHLMWKKVRIPLFVGIGLLVLAAAAVLVGFWIRSAAIRSAVAEARASASLDTVDGLRDAVTVLGELAGDYRERGDVQAAYAYVVILDAIRHGPTEPGLEKARSALKRSSAGTGGDLYVAAAILVHLASGEPEEARGLVESLSTSGRQDHELRLACAMSQIESGQNLEAQTDLMLMAAAKDPFLPAVTLLGKVRHRTGDLKGANELLRASLEAHPGRLEASLERVLVLVDLATEGTLAEAGGLLEALGADLDAAPPVLATRGLYAEGLLLLALEKHMDASGPLCKALESMSHNALAAARCARARRLSGDVQGALKVVENLRLGEGTSTEVLVEIVEANLNLWRPRAASLALQLMQGRPDVGEKRMAQLSALAALQAGDFAKAASRYRSGGGGDDLPIRAGLAYLEAGEAGEARGYLKKISSGPSAGCAEALYEWSRGRLEEALGKVGKSEACAPALRGRFLFLLGRHQEASEMLGKALAQHDDPRLRLMLARATLRISGPGEAKVMLDHLRDLGAESITLLTGLADAYLELDLVDDARGVAADAVARNPGKPEGLALQARILRQTGDPATAAEIAAKGLEAHPDHPGLLAEQAHVHLAAKEYGEAIEAGQKALVPGPYYLVAALVATRALEAAGRQNDADGLIREAGNTLLRQHEPTLAASAWAFFVQMRKARGGKPNISKARGLFYGLLKKDIPGAAFYYQGAVVLFADGRRDDAVMWLHKAAGLDPLFKHPFERLSRMGELTDEEVKAYTTVHGVAP